MTRILCLTLAVLMICATVGCVTTQTQTPTDDPATETPSDDTGTEQTEPSATTDNLLLNEKATANNDILPRGIDKNHEWVTELKDQTIVLYYCTQNDAFSYKNGAVSETGWLKGLQSEYGITIHALRKSEKASLAAQRVALLSGKQLDLLSFTPSQLPYAPSMTADATALLEGQSSNVNDFLNQTILTYADNGKRFFSPAGVARNLWYVKQESTSPLSMSESQLWDWIAFSNFVKQCTVTEGDKVKVYGYEAQDFTDFFAAMGTPVITYDNGAFSAALSSAADTLADLQKLNAGNGYYYNGQSKENQPTLVDGTLVMRYGQTPFTTVSDKYPEIEWAPLPNAERYQGTGLVSACAPILALPKDGPQNKAALCAALLWTARAADANHDQLRFTYGVNFENWTKYYTATNKQMQIVIGADDDITASLRRLAGSDPSEEDDYDTLTNTLETYCINANERL